MENFFMNLISLRECVSFNKINEDERIEMRNYSTVSLSEGGS